MRSIKNLAVFLTVITVTLVVASGCAGTRAAYKAADGLSETAYVVGEHYFAEIRAVNDLDEAGRLSPSELRNLQSIATKTRPLIVNLLDSANAYDNVKSAANEAALSDALAEAAISLSNLINAVKAVGDSSTGRMSTCFLQQGAPPGAVNYCEFVAAR